MQIKVIFIRIVLHLDALWNRGTRELGNGLLNLKVHALHYANELLVRIRLAVQKLLQTRQTGRSNKKLQKRVLVMIKHCLGISEINSIPEWRVFLLNKSLRVQQARAGIIHSNHKNYNFLACDWFKNALFYTNSLAKLSSDSLLLDSLLLDSLLSDSLISQSYSKM